MRYTDDMAVMIRVAERRGFTAAAGDVGLTASAVAKLVARLEHRLGVRLLNRTTRRVTLTAEGERYVARAREILADISQFEREVSALGAAPRGVLRVACGTAVGLDPILQALPGFAARYPEIEIDFRISDRRVDLIDEQIDLALRLGNLNDSALVARRICTFERVVCAAPRYLDRAGQVTSPDDLRSHQCLYVTAHTGLNRWSFRDDDKTKVIEVHGRMRFDDAATVFRAGLAGLGVMRISDVLAAPELHAGRLIPLLIDSHVSEPVDLMAIMPAGRQRSPKVRVFLDFLLGLFGQAHWRKPNTSGAAAT